MERLIHRALLGMKESMVGGRVLSGNKGISLIGVVIMMTAIVLVGAALLTMGTSESELVAVGVDEANAFYAAEAGVERAREALDHMAKWGAKIDKGRFKPDDEQPEGVYPDDLEFDGETLRGSSYTVTVEKTGMVDPWFTAYEVVSRGEHGSAQREIHATLALKSVCDFAYLAQKADDLSGDFEEIEDWDPDYDGHVEDDIEDQDAADSLDIHFFTGDYIDGKVHINEKIKIKGDPIFGGPVTTWKDKIDIKHGSRPVFRKGLKLKQDGELLPKDKDVEETMEEMAGLILPKPDKSEFKQELKDEDTDDPVWQIEMGRDGMLGTVSYRCVEKNDKEGPKDHHATSWVDLDVASIPNGVIWVTEEELYIGGVLQGRLTVGAEKEVWIHDNIIYADSTPGQGPNPGCTDMFGLVSIKKIKFIPTNEIKHGVEFHGALMCVKEKIECEDVEDFDGDLMLYGSMIEKETGKLNKFKWDDKKGLYKFEGLHRKIMFDDRLAVTAPPFFPKSCNVGIVRWAETPVSGD